MLADLPLADLEGLQNCSCSLLDALARSLDPSDGLLAATGPPITALLIELGRVNSAFGSGYVVGVKKGLRPLCSCRLPLAGSPCGSPAVGPDALDDDVVALILVSRENPRWGHLRIVGECT